MSNIPIQNIDDLELPDDKFGASMLFCGSTRSGKTTLLNYLYGVHFGKHSSVLMSNSLNSDAYDYLKRFCILSDLYHPEILREMYQINHATKNHYKFCVVLDDLSNVKNDKEYQRLLTIYRNSRISAMISAQGITMFNKTCRGNINFVCLGRMNSDAEVEKVIKEYLISYYPKGLNMGEKIALYRHETNDHWWYVLDQINGKIFRTKLRPEQILVPTSM
jgi:energy-coupling factor transporter ATP-binding protein EcfA2